MLYRDARVKRLRSDAKMAISIILIGLLILLAPAEASSVKRLECQEWIDGKYQGIYIISYDEASNKLTVRTDADIKNEKGMPFPQRWKVLWKNDRRVISSSVDDKDWGGPVHVMILNFAEPSIFLHIPHMTEGVYQVNTRVQGERKCRQPD
jgi:hypothetical protein